MPPHTWQACELGRVGRVGLGFTDAAALPAAWGGGCLYTAVAEDSRDAIADGACVASGIGRLDAQGRPCGFRRLHGAPKVEGIDLQPGPRGRVTLCLATDPDDPLRASQLLRATLAGF